MKSCWAYSLDEQMHTFSVEMYEIKTGWSVYKALHKPLIKIALH